MRALLGGSGEGCFSGSPVLTKEPSDVNIYLNTQVLGIHSA